MWKRAPRSIYRELLVLGVAFAESKIAGAKDNAFFNNLGYAKDPTQEATRALFAADIMDWFDQGAYYYKGSLTTHSHVWGARGVACRQGGPESGKGRSQRDYCPAREPQQSRAPEAQ